MAARRSLSAEPGAAYVNRATTEVSRRAPARPPRAVPLAWRLAPRAPCATHGRPASQSARGGPCRRVPGRVLDGPVVHDDALATLRRWPRRRVG